MTHWCIGPPRWSSVSMVLCLIVGCSKRSGRDKDVSFYRVPQIITNKGPRKEELSRRRRAGFIAAISQSS